MGLLPNDEGFNCILTMTDHLGSDVQIIPTCTNIMAQKLAMIFFSEWYCENGLTPWINLGLRQIVHVKVLENIAHVDWSPVKDVYSVPLSDRWWKWTHEQNTEPVYMVSHWTQPEGLGTSIAPYSI